MARPRIVILGAGYAGLVTALTLQRLAGQSVHVTLVDRRAAHQLITRLHLVAAERMAPAGAAIPLTELVAPTAITTRRATVEGIDLARGLVHDTCGTLPYDRLIVALGSVPDDQGIPGVGEHALLLRSLADATRLHSRLRAAVYHAARARQSLLILLVGGGPTGVELAAELSAWLTVVADRSDLPRARWHVGVIEVAHRLLPRHDAWLGQQAAAALAGLGVRCHLRASVAAVEPSALTLADGKRLPADLVIWTAGIRAPSLLAAAGLPMGADGRVGIDSRLATLGHPEVLVLGNSALTLDPATGIPYEPSAQLAVQQAQTAAWNLWAERTGVTPAPFQYRLPAEVLSLGPGGAVARLGDLPLRGLLAVAVDQAAERRYLLQLGGPALVRRQVARERDWARRPALEP